MYSCPNCHSPLEQAAVTCARCGADFGPTAAWRPVVVSGHIGEQARTARVPSLFNALSALGAFPLAVPPLGALLLLLAEGTSNSLSFPVVALTLVFSYSFAGAPALAAGLVFAGIAGGCVIAFRMARLPSLLAAVFGAVSGGLVMAANFAFLSGQLLPISRGALQTVFLTAICCAVVGAAPANLFPVGIISSEQPNAG